MSPLVARTLIDAAAGTCLLWYAVRRQRRNREWLALVAGWLLVCAGVLGYLALPADEPGRLPPPPGVLV